MPKREITKIVNRLQGVTMKMTIALTGEEFLFLQDFQNLINSKKRFGQERLPRSELSRLARRKFIIVSSPRIKPKKMRSVGGI
jgi:hypothetical protein